MKARILILSFLAISIAHLSFGQAKEHRIVFHLANSDTLVHKALVKQLSNVLDYWPTAKIEVVVHNNGIGFMKADEARFAKEIAALKGCGVAFAVCENTLRLRKIDKTQILPTAFFVPVGLAEIVLKEEEGWSYIKAGF
jgi:uncharacterized protein